MKHWLSLAALVCFGSSAQALGIRGGGSVNGSAISPLSVAAATITLTGQLLVNGGPSGGLGLKVSSETVVIDGTNAKLTVAHDTSDRFIFDPVNQQITGTGNWFFDIPNAAGNYRHQVDNVTKSYLSDAGLSVAGAGVAASVAATALDVKGGTYISTGGVAGYYSIHADPTDGDVGVGEAAPSGSDFHVGCPNGAASGFCRMTINGTAGAEILGGSTTGGMYIGTNASGAATRIVSGTGIVGILVDGNQNVEFPVMARVTATHNQAIAGAGTITANSCGGVKGVQPDTTNQTTNTTNTFTAPDSTNTGCCMDVINYDTANTLTLDSNANFQTIGAADVVLTPCDAVRVCSTGSKWYQVTPLAANTCN